MQKNSTPPIIFNRGLIKNNRSRAAVRFEKHDFLFREMASRVTERLEYIKRDFPIALDLGAKNGIVAEILAGRGGIKTLVQSEFSEKLLANAGGARVVASEEFLPFADNSFDLVLSVGALHSVNDLTGTLIQIRRILKPDGLFIGMIFGGQTLRELRASFETAEIEQKGGISPRVAPFVDVRDGGSLLQRAGFVLPVVDSEILNVEYTHPLKLMHDLRGMGEGNFMVERSKKFTPCSMLMQVVDNYLRDFSNQNGRVDASFELVTLTGWKAALTK